MTRASYKGTQTTRPLEGANIAAAMPGLTLHLHGTARVVSADGRELVLERRAAALCALVALEPGFARERAAG